MEVDIFVQGIGLNKVMAVVIFTCILEIFCILYSV